ncbi:hypothetical protein CPC08DRAFT_430226 [Agrocybe pediades]|nr:hypothetical protein CPC08DRAFT_430226 [Agrocybe pediades]
MAPKLKVLAYNAKLEKRLQNDISSSLASVLSTNPKMTPKEAMWSVTNKLLTNNPYHPPQDGKCAINELPNELLSYIFQVGVNEEEAEEWEDDEEEDVWEDVDSEDEESQSGSEGSDSEDGSVLDIDDDSDSDSEMDEDEVEEPHLPFQVLVSHVCRRWREVALDSHMLWTNLDFAQRPRLGQAKAYIERAQGLPLNIYIDCTFSQEIDEEDHPDHPLYQDNEARKKAHSTDCGNEDCAGHDEEPVFLSQDDLSQILDLVEPEVSHWRSLDFRASTYGYIQSLLSRLHKLPAAPMLETMQICHFEDCDDYEFFSGDDKTFYLPFHGDAPLLKDLALWGVHIDWDAQFLRGLRELELSYHAKDVRPSYKAFASMINNSPDLKSLTLSLSGPVLPEGVAFDADPEEQEGAWGPTPLTIPSLRDLGSQFHEVNYAIALAQHIDAPAVTNMLLNFDRDDYSQFVHTLVKPVEGRSESILQHVETLKISGLPCNYTAVEALLSHLGNLKSLNLKVMGDEEKMIFRKLADPKAIPEASALSPITPGLGGQAPLTPLVAAPTSEQGSAPPAAASSPTSANASLPTLFCPGLESLTTSDVDGAEIKQLIIARRALGAAPLKRVLMSHHDHISKKDEKWIRDNVEELEFYEPSDSEDELEEILIDGIALDSDEDGGEGSEGEEDDDSAGEEEELRDENGEPLLSPLARHMRRGRGRHAPGGAGGLD